MATNPDIMAAIRHPELFGRWFRDPNTWRAWFAFLCSLFGLPMVDELLAIFRRCTERVTAPTAAFRVAWLICGRRAGKSFIAALVAIFAAVFIDWSRWLAPGERATVMLIAVDRRQTRVLMRYMRAMLRTVPALAQLIERETAESIDLSNSVTIEVHTASFRTTRGYAVCCCIIDEIAYLRDEASANPDAELIAALRPAMAQFPQALLLCLSSPYARRGALWNAFTKHFGKDDAPELVWRASSAIMNPTLRSELIEAARADDPARAAAEWDAEFRSDLAAAFDAAWIDSAVDPGISVRARQHSLQEGRAPSYVSFTDPAGGNGKDSWSTRIVHIEGDHVVDDALFEIRPPFNTADAAKQVADFLKGYGLSHTTGDKYAGAWPSDALRLHGITYGASEHDKSTIYKECVGLYSAGRVRLLDHLKTLAQLRSLERRVRPGGRDQFDHPPGANDDNANALCGAILLANRRGARSEPTCAYTTSVLDGINGDAALSGDSFVSIFEEHERQAADRWRPLDF